MIAVIYEVVGSLSWCCFVDNAFVEDGEMNLSFSFGGDFCCCCSLYQFTPGSLLFHMHCIYRTNLRRYARRLGEQSRGSIW